MKRFAAPILAFALSVVPAAAGERIVVVELFTSQGCSSCPPADAFLGELSKRPDVLALSLHVDYWDYIGWKDPFAQRLFSDRQRNYSRVLHQRFVYTPQMIVNGQRVGVGSDRAEMNRLLGEAVQERRAASRQYLRIEGNELRISGNAPAPSTITLVTYEKQHRTPVVKGENKGRQLANYNVVREWRELARYDGQAMSVPLDVDPATFEKSGCAVLMQQQTVGGLGAIVAAATVDPPSSR